MHWIIERAPRDEDTDPLLWIATGRRSGTDDMARLIEVLRDRGIRHDVVRKPPIADYLVAMDRDPTTEHDEPLLIHVDGPVFAYGSTTLELVSRRSGWTPGYFDAPEMLETISHWGEHMLNHDVQVGEIGTMATPEGSFFIRPDVDGKAFAGQVMDDVDFEAWRARVLDVKGWTSLPRDTRVLYGPVRRIHAEWRLAIVAGRIAAASQYRKGGRLQTMEGAPEDVLAYARSRVAEWEPRPAFVMDVCETDRGYRIVETNSISSAGFYRMDMASYVDAIERDLLEAVARAS